MMWMKSCRINLVILVALGFASPIRAEDYAIRDGDTVVFMGDSITAARSYGKIIENYTLLRYPQRKVRFINAGIGGDTAAGGLKRLERDVFQNHATVLTVAYGVNDIGWGLKADDEHSQTYLASVRGIVEACKKHGVRVYICSAAITAADPSQSEDSFLQKMCDEGMEASRKLGGAAIDVQRGMRAIQKRVWAANVNVADKTKHTTLHAADGIHLNDLGQLAMAFAILKGLGAPAEVSSVTIDARGPKLGAASGCTIRDLVSKSDTLEFTRLDDGLPFNYGIFFGLNYRFVPIPDELNRYQLMIKNLPEGQYEVAAGGRVVGKYSAQQLAAGVNISSATPDPWQPGGPWNAQANILQSLTDARHQIIMAKNLAGVYVPDSRTYTDLSPAADKSIEHLEEMQRSVARPQPYSFVIQRHDLSKQVK